jgi:murein DD-endopeptidase MepM/ murein hydrolase activator NlpD
MELARINGIGDASKISVGQRIFIPGATRPLPVEIITPADALIGSDRDGAYDGRLPPEFIWPVLGTTVSGYGPRGGSFHDGIDISAPEGTVIRAVAEGEVIYSDQLRGYGNLIIIRHGNGLVSVYSHNRKNLVREGQTVRRGDVIGEVGSTGRVSGPHLHFEVRKDNKARNPLNYLPQDIEASGCVRC